MRLIKNRRGQATVEYILMLAVMVGFTLLVITRLIKPAFEKISNSVNKSLEDKLIHTDLHFFKIGK